VCISVYVKLAIEINNIITLFFIHFENCITGGNSYLVIEGPKSFSEM